LKQLLREYPEGEGKISISGIPIQDLSLSTLQSWIGYVPQDQMLFSRSVRENLLFGKIDGNDQDVDRVLNLADFQKDIHVLPEGLETLVGEKGVALSGGQKQRVSIARALMIDPEILILDDAMSAVDGKTEAQIISNIRSERSSKTTFIATHRLSGVKHADWILVLDDGVVIEEGTHDQLLVQQGWYREQYDRQQLEDSLKEVL
ncbi:MAG: ABC transporter ATP-binding protein, partial [Anaerobacillus sp.]